MFEPILTISPKSCLQDEKIILKVTGLVPNSPYTLTSHLLDTRKNTFFSYAHYYADRDGIIDTSQHESFGGHYKGIFQMGLIAGLQPAPDEYRFLRLFKRDVENPNEIEFKVYENFITSEEIFSSSYLLNGFHSRYFMGPGVERIPIKSGRVRATLFIPVGEGPFPAVVDMFGSSGGLLEYRSAQLASRGIASLALAIFNYDDLPKTINEFDLKYFQEAVDILLSHKKIRKPHVGVIGVSKGADLAISMATFIPEVSCAVSINGSISCLKIPFRVTDDYVIPALIIDIKNAKIIDKVGVSYNECYPEPEDYPQTIIPIYKCDAKFLFIVGEDDLISPSKKYAEISARLLREANKENNYKVCSYKGAGHLLEPPYSPLCYSSYDNLYGTVTMWGGKVKEHSEAQEKSWVEIINFVKENLDIVQSKL